jgi:hypothetical protein
MLSAGPFEARDALYKTCVYNGECDSCGLLLWRNMWTGGSGKLRLAFSSRVSSSLAGPIIYSLAAMRTMQQCQCGLVDVYHILYPEDGDNWFLRNVDIIYQTTRRQILGNLRPEINILPYNWYQISLKTMLGYMTLNSLRFWSKKMEFLLKPSGLMPLAAKLILSRVNGYFRKGAAS